MAAAAQPVEETLAQEAQQAPRAATVAMLAGLFTVAGTVLQGVALRDRPTVTLPDGLRDIANPTSNHGLLEPTLLFVKDKLALLTAGQLLTALAAPLAALALVYLFRATRARNPGLGQGALIAVAAGGIASLVGGFVGQIAVDISVSNFIDAADHSTKAAHDALQPSIALTAGLIGFVGHVALGLGIVLVALNAMRVGLLTRFMGVLGIMAGVFLAFPFFSIPIVQAFWLVGIGILFLGRFPNGTPPAWETGRAEPWPSRQQMMEQQGKAPGGRGAPKVAGPPPAADPLASAPERPAHVRSKKKKRRR
ncbi:MAG: hypothetical protein QOG68_1167 [Solirubrobacteraceae bacterium]|nr:hypothetical protein [Solirubrobacteraceae bacterium]